MAPQKFTSSGSDWLLRKSINGTHALDMRYMPIAMLIFFPISIFLEGVAGLSRHNHETVILSSALGWMAVFTFFKCLNLWWGMHQRPALSIAFLLLLSGAGGMIQTTVESLTVRILGFNPEYSIIRYICIGFFSWLIWLPINAFLVSSILVYRERRADLLQRLNTLRAISFKQNGLAQKVSQIVEDEVIRDLNWSRTTARMRFQSSIEKNVEGGIDPQLLKSYAGEELRSISHNLWARSKKEIVPIQTKKSNSVTELFKLSLRLPPISVWVYCFIYGSALIPIFLKDSRSPIELLNVAFILICFYFLMVAGEALYERFPQFSPQIYTLKIAIAVYAPFFLLWFINPSASILAPSRTLPFQVSSFLLVALVVAILTLGKATAYSQDQILDALDKATKSQKAQVNLAAIEIAAVSRQWAQYIHGNLQSRLLAAAAILEKTVEGIDIHLKEAAVVEATRIMSGDFDAPELSNRSLLDEVNFQVSHWRDLIEIEIDYSLEKDPAWISASEFGAVVEQAIANAFRHGSATKVSISIHLDGDGWLECNFTDNGIGGASNQPAGLGSSIFDVFAKGNWSFRPGPDGIGTCLHMIIPALELPPARGGSSVG